MEETFPRLMKNLIVALVVMGAVIGGGYWYFSNDTISSAAKAEAKKFSIADTYSDERPPAQNPSQIAGVAATQAAPITANNPHKSMTVTLHTNLGDITIDLMETDAPKTVANFLKLAEQGFYNGTKFHRVIKDFMIQGGDPLTKDDTMAPRWGTGGPGYQFEDEIHTNNTNMVGTIAMANAGPDTNGSQFFLNVANNNFLDPKHTVFGKVTAGMDIVAKIQRVATGAGDRPVTPVVIESVSLQ